MPSLQWIGKEKVVNHHQEVPYRVLEHKYGFRADDPADTTPTNSGNKIIHGDNLEALKSLLPEYEGRVKCIYIDPPYNTGNEKWIYNDNVNDPKIKKWLGEVVGKQGEDLSRHDKWLCMMYPRLKLLHKLLADDGVIFISIDDNEEKYLHLIMDEIFGNRCFIHKIIWKNKYGPGALTKGVGNVHEYIICYSKNPIESVAAPLSEEEIKKYKLKDEKYSIRGGYITQPLATKSKDDRINLVYPLCHNGAEIWPDKQWIWEKSRLYKAIENNDVVFNENNGKWSVRFKQYLKDEHGNMRYGKPISILVGPYNQDGTSEITTIFDQKLFNNPKPQELIQYLLSWVFNSQDNKNGIILDSFAGSGTTAHAVLNLNKKDGGNRKFILVEMEDYAENITAERVRRVMNGYGEGKNAVAGTGGAFDFYELGAPMFDQEKNLNEEIDEEKIREYIYYTETKRHLDRKRTEEAKYLLDTYNGTGYYFYYEKDCLMTLSIDTLSIVTERTEQYVIYADICTVPPQVLAARNITFKKIPRDIKRF